MMHLKKTLIRVNKRRNRKMHSNRKMTAVANPQMYGKKGFCTVSHEGRGEDNYKSICIKGVQPQGWSWVHGRPPKDENSTIKDLSPLLPGWYRILYLVHNSGCWVMNSERNVQYRYDNERMQAGMLPLTDHFELCHKIDRFRKRNPGKNVFVSTYKGERMDALEWGVQPWRGEMTDTSFRFHSEIHTGPIDPSQFLLAYYRPESDEQPIRIWKNSRLACA